MKCLEVSLEMKLQGMSSSFDKLGGPEGPLDDREQDESKSENPGKDSEREDIERSIARAAGKYNLSPEFSYK